MTRRSRRGQNSFELIVLIGFLLIVSFGFILAIQTKIREQRVVNQQSLYSQAADMFEREVLLAARLNNGYTRAFEIPPTLEGEAYVASIEGTDTFVIDGIGSANEHIRFLSVDVTLVHPAGDENLSVVPAGSRTVIVQKNATGLYVRKDCVAQGRTVMTCV